MNKITKLTCKLNELGLFKYIVDSIDWCFEYNKNKLEITFDLEIDNFENEKKELDHVLQILANQYFNKRK